MSRGKVWITRTMPAAETTAMKVRSAGFEPVIAPLLEVSPPPQMPPMPESGAVLIFTSKNGVNALCGLTNRRDWKVVTVGDETAKLARSLGFDAVQSASGASLDVTELIIGSFASGQLIVHCAGRNVTGSISDDLRAAGYKSRRDIYYQVCPVKSIPGNLLDIRYVLIHSPRAARFLEKLNPDIGHMTAVSISAAADKALNNLVLRERRVANSPNERSIIAALDA